MAESTLAAAYNDLMAAVAFFMGFGRGVAYGDQTWTVQQQSSIDYCVKSGLRQFYFPPAIEGEAGAYDWSFLKPVATADFPLNAKTIPMPDDFGGFEGEITLLSTTAQVWHPIRLTSEGNIREEYSRCPTAVGRPTMAGLQPLKGTAATQGQRFQLFVYPQADQDYTLQFQYYLLPDYLSGAFPYVYGGAAHAETVLASCKAIAEQDMDDATGVQTMKFMERLRASISLDRRSKPENIGYNGDRSDRQMGRRDWNLPAGITYRGTQY